MSNVMMHKERKNTKKTEKKTKSLYFLQEEL